MKSGAIAFYTNTLPGADTDMSLYASYYTHHYVVLAVPKVVLPPGMDLDIVYDMGMFIQSLFTYGLIYAWITWLGVRFLRKINFRLDRIGPWLVTHDMAGEKGESKLIASLFLTYHSSPVTLNGADIFIMP